MGIWACYVLHGVAQMISVSREFIQYHDFSKKKELYDSMRTFALHFLACPVTVFSTAVPHAEPEPIYLLKMAGILKWTLLWQNLIFKRPLCLGS